MRRRFKHLTWEDRIRIETLHREKRSNCYIAKMIGVHKSTISRELERGMYEHMNYDLTVSMRYSADLGQQRYEEKQSKKGSVVKIAKDPQLLKDLEYLIAEEKYSPVAALLEVKNGYRKYRVTICTATLYSYIDKHVFESLTNADLPVKKMQKRMYRKIIRRRKREAAGESIEHRPPEVDERNTFGHWEMDTVIGKRGISKQTLLVFTERLTRIEIIKPLPNKKAESVCRALKQIRKYYGKLFPKVFKSITVDNGSEFAAYKEMRRALGKNNNIEIYYCHPYSSWERGSNEVANRLIRRHIPKGTDLDKISLERIKEIEQWINHYPRRLFNGESAMDRFEQQLALLATS